MPDDLTPSDKAVFVLFDGIALALMFAGVDWLIAGKHWPPAVISFGIAFVLALIAHNWSVAKLKLGQRLSPFAHRIEEIAADYRYRVGSLFLVALLLGVILLYNIGTVRHDFDLYVAPRIVTKEQSDALQKALSASSPDIKVTIFTNVADREALEYGGELFNAIKAGGWDAQFQPVNPWGPNLVTPTRPRPFNNILVVMNEGLMLNTCLVGQPTNPDPKHPTPDAMLSDALAKAHIDVNGGGSAADCGRYSLDIVVGRRPVNQQPNFFFKPESRN